MQKNSIICLYLVCLLVGLGLALPARAQQVPQLSQYTLNQQMFNPAVSGIEDYIATRVGFRQQYQGLPDGPKTFYANAHGALNQRELNKEDLGALPMRGASSIRFKTETIRKIRHGIGGSLVSDQPGQWTRNSFGASYAIHIPFAHKWYFSGGAGLGASVIKIGSNYQNTYDDPSSDPALKGGSKTVLDAQLGAMVYNERFYAGISAGQLFQNKLKYGTQNVNATEDKLDLVYFLNAGYRFTLSDELEFLPTTLVKYSHTSYAADFQGRFRFRQGFYAGAGFRASGKSNSVDATKASVNNNTLPDAAIVLVGLSFNKLVDVAYSYDFTTSKLSSGSNGSHEIVLGLRLNNKKKANPRIW
jgi:type IX secretion system PorP/SprF family membrane protein